jgi:hypothetical protein
MCREKEGTACPSAHLTRSVVFILKCQFDENANLHYN